MPATATAIVCADVDDKTVEAVRKAAASMVPVTAGVGVAMKTASWETGG